VAAAAGQQNPGVTSLAELAEGCRHCYKGQTQGLVLSLACLEHFSLDATGGFSDKSGSGCAEKWTCGSPWSGPRETHSTPGPWGVVEGWMTVFALLSIQPRACPLPSDIDTRRTDAMLRAGHPWGGELSRLNLHPRLQRRARVRVCVAQAKSEVRVQSWILFANVLCHRMPGSHEPG